MQFSLFSYCNQSQSPSLSPWSVWLPMMDSENSRQDHVSLQDQYCSPNYVHHQRLQKGDVRRKYSVCWAYPCPQVVSRDALPSAGRDSPTTALRGKLPRPSSLPDQLLATLNSPGGKRQVGEASGNKQSGKWKCWRKKLLSRQPRLRQDGLQPCYQVSDLFVWTLHTRVTDSMLIGYGSTILS